MVDWNKLLQDVLSVVLVALAVGATRALMAWSSAKLAEVKQWGPSLGSWLENAADFAVKAAEQTGLTGAIKDKKSYALQLAEDWLAAHDVTVDLHLLDAAIEKAVIEQFPHETKPQP